MIGDSSWHYVFIWNAIDLNIECFLFMKKIAYIVTYWNLVVTDKTRSFNNRVKSSLCPMKSVPDAVCARWSLCPMQSVPDAVCDIYARIIIQNILNVEVVQLYITTNKMQLCTIIYLFLVSSTCFGRCFRPSSGYLQLLVMSTDVAAG